MMMRKKFFLLTTTATTAIIIITSLVAFLTHEVTSFVAPRSHSLESTTRRWSLENNDNGGGVGGGNGGDRNQRRNRRSSNNRRSATTDQRNRNKIKNKSNRNNSRQEVGYSYRNDGIKIKRKRPPKWEVEGDSLFFLQSDSESSTGGTKKGIDKGNDGDEGEKLFDELYKLALNNNKQKNSGGDNHDNVDDGNDGNTSVLRDVLRLAFEEEASESRGKNGKDQGQRQSKSQYEEDKNIVKNEMGGKHQEKQQTQKSPPPFLSNMMWGPLSVGPILKLGLETMYDKDSEPTPIQQEAFKVLTKKNNNNKSGNGYNAVIASPTGSGKTLAYVLPLLATSSKKKDERKILIVTPTLDLSCQIQKVVDQLWGEGGVYVMQSAAHSSSSDTGISSQQIMEWNVEGMILSKAPIIASTPRILMEVATMCSKSNNKRYNSIFSNIKTVVLDEADRLLQTELVARQNHEMKNTNNSKNNFKSRSQKILKNDSSAIQLLSMLEQKMGLSFDVQQQQQQGGGRRVQLICASATVGRTLRRQIMEITNASSIEKGSILITADDRTGKNAMKRKSSLLPPTIKHIYAVTSSTPTSIDVDADVDDSIENDLANSIAQKMDLLEAGPSIIFPGRVGVQKVVDAMRGIHDFKGIKTLRDNNYNHNEETDDQEENKTNKAWTDVPIVVVGEKFGRGLDIPGVRYVFISSPPSSPAAYAHLAGRTGRAGKDGIAVTFVRDLKEAKRLITLSNKLGLHFEAIEGMNERTSDESETMKTIGRSTTLKECDDQDDHDLNNLNMNTLKDMLRERNLKVSGRKSELIERLMENMESGTE